AGAVGAGMGGGQRGRRRHQVSAGGQQGAGRVVQQPAPLGRGQRGDDRLRHRRNHAVAVGHQQAVVTQLSGRSRELIGREPGGRRQRRIRQAQPQRQHPGQVGGGGRQQRQLPLY